MENNSALAEDINDHIKSRKERKKQKGFKAVFEKFSAAITRATGSSSASLLPLQLLLFGLLQAPFLIFQIPGNWS